MGSINYRIALTIHYSWVDYLFYITVANSAVQSGSTSAQAPPQVERSGETSRAEIKIKEKKTDANVVLIPLRILGDEPHLVTGDPITCAQCMAVLTSTAVLKADGDTKKWEW